MPLGAYFMDYHETYWVLNGHEKMLWFSENLNAE